MATLVDFGINRIGKVYIHTPALLHSTVLLTHLYYLRTYPLKWKFTRSQDSRPWFGHFTYPATNISLKSIHSPLRFEYWESEQLTVYVFMTAYDKSMTSWSENLTK